MKRLIAPALLAMLFSCGSGNAQYFHISIAPFSALTGTNCGSATTINTWTGVEASNEWAIYPAPNNQFLLDGSVSLLLLTGKQNGSTYSFTGSETTVTTPGRDTVTKDAAYTITLTTNGPGVTGTIAEATTCKSSSGNGCDSGSGNGNDYTCSQSASLQGTLLPNVTAFHSNVAAAGTLGQ